MSFLSILRKIGSTVIGAERVVAPIAEDLLPAYSGTIAALDGIFQRLQAAIATAETTLPQDGQGSVKLPAVIADFDAGLELTQSILAAEGKKLTYDPVQLKAAIDSQVAAFNAMADVKASFKIVSF